MTDTQHLSEAKRTLLNKYLRGNVVQARVGPPPIPRRAPGEPIPMSFGQQQLWLVAQLAPDVPAYNECITVGLPGPLNVAVSFKPLRISRGTRARTAASATNRPASRA